MSKTKKHVTKPNLYGSVSNLIRLRKVWMVTHTEGNGTPESPLREVRTFFDEHGAFLSRDDQHAPKHLTDDWHTIH
jgi:hypothetical protein